MNEGLMRLEPPWYFFILLSFICFTNEYYPTTYTETTMMNGHHKETPLLPPLTITSTTISTCQSANMGNSIPRRVKTWQSGPRRTTNAVYRRLGTCFFFLSFFYFTNDYLQSVYDPQHPTTMTWARVSSPRFFVLFCFYILILMMFTVWSTTTLARPRWHI